MEKEEQYLSENYPPEVIEDIEFSNSIKQAYSDGMLEGLKVRATEYIPVKIGSSTLHINASRVNAFMVSNNSNGEIDVLIANMWYHVKDGKEFLKKLNIYEMS